MKVSEIKVGSWVVGLTPSSRDGVPYVTFITTPLQPRQDAFALPADEDLPTVDRARQRP